MLENSKETSVVMRSTRVDTADFVQRHWHTYARTVTVVPSVESLVSQAFTKQRVDPLTDTSDETQHQRWLIPLVLKN